MLTCKSPRRVMRAAFHLSRQALPKYSSRFSRHDFTLPQLFACLVLKEHQRQSYRQVEALLQDSPEWCRDIGMRKAPDHNTLCRAFHALNLGRRHRKLLDRLTQWFAIARQLGSIVRSIPASTTLTTAAGTMSSAAGITPRSTNARLMHGEALRPGEGP